MKYTRLRISALTTFVYLSLISEGAHADLFQGQQHGSALRVVPNAATCDHCRVRATKQVEVGGGGAAYVDITARIAITPSEIVVANHSTPYELKVFTHDGAYLRTVGRYGGGPTDFRQISDLRYSSSDGRLYVLDAGNSRIAVLSNALQPVNTIQLPGRPIERGLLLLTDAFLINAIVATPERIGYPLHIVDSAGSIIKSFGGADTAVFRPYQANRQIRRLAATNGGFWIAHYIAYHIERYDLTGERTASISRRPTWFPDSGAAQPNVQLGSPVSNIVDIQEDPSGRLWIISRVPDPNWRSAISTSVGPHGPSYSIDSYTDYFDTIIDVIDPIDAKLIATARWAGYAVRFIDTLTVAVYDDSSTEPHVSVWVLSLEGPR